MLTRKTRKLFVPMIWAAALAAATSATATPSPAATVGFWDAGSGEWTNPVNWTSNPLFPSSPDDFAYFESPASITVTVASPVSVGGILFDLNTVILSSTTGGSITLSSTTGQSEIIATSTLAGNGVTFQLPVNLASNLTITGDSSPAMVFSAAFTGTGNLTLNGTGIVNLRGSSSAWSPASILVESGVLSTASGVLTSLGNPNSGAITVQSGASLDVSGITFSTASTFTKTLFLSGAGNTASPGAVVFGATNTNLLGLEYLSGATTFYGKSASAVLNIGNTTGAASSATILGTGPLIKSGAGTMQINIPASFTGGTQVNAGTLTISPYGSLVGTGPISVSTSAKLTLSKPAGGDAATNSVSPNSIALNGGTLGIAVDISLANLFSSTPINGILSIDTATFTAGGSNMIDFSSLAPGSIVRLTSTTGSLPATLSLIPQAGVNMIYLGGTFTDSATIADVGGIPTNVQYGGGGSITLNATSSYTGTTYINNQTITLTSPFGLGGTAGNTQVNGGSLYINASANEPVTLVSGFVAVNPAGAGGTGAITVTGGSLSLGANWGQTITLAGGSLGITAAGLATPILVNGGNLLQAAASTSDPITLSGGTVTISTTLNGTVTLNAGTLRQTGTGAFSTATVLMNGGLLSLASGQNFPAMLNPQSTGGIISINATGSFTGSLNFSAIPAGTGFLIGSTVAASIQPPSTLVPDGADNTLHFGGTGNKGTLTINSPIGDANSTPTNIIVDPPMTVVLATVNTYSGTTVVNGFLQVNNSAGLGSGTGGNSDGTTVNTGGTLVTGPGVTLPDEQITVNGGFINAVDGGPIIVDAPSLLGGTLTGAVSDPFNLSVNSALVLSGVNTFGGQVNVVSGGKLTVASPSSLGNGSSAVTVDTGGTLTLAAALTQPIAIAGGTLIDNANYSGNISMSGGSFSLATGAIYSGIAVVSAGIFSAAGSITGSLSLGQSTLTLVGGMVSGTGAVMITSGVIRGAGTISVPIELQGSNVRVGDSSSSLTFTAALAGSQPWNFGDPGATMVYSGSETFETAVHIPSAGMNVNNGYLYFNSSFDNDGPTNINSGWVYFSGTINTFGGATVLSTNGRASFNNATFNSSFSGSSLMVFSGTTTFNGPAILDGINYKAPAITFQGPVLFNGPGTLGGSIAFATDVTIAQLDISTSGLSVSGGHTISTPGPVALQGSVNASISAPEFTINADWAQLVNVGSGGGPVSLNFGTTEIVTGLNPLGNPGNSLTVASDDAVAYVQGGTLTNNIDLNNSNGILFLGALGSAGNTPGLLNSSLAYLAGDVDLGPDHSVIGGGPTEIEFGGPVSGGGLTVRQAGVIIGNSDNTYTGPTIIENGSLYFGVNGDLATTSSVQLYNSAINVDGANVATSVPLELLNGRIIYVDNVILGPIVLLGGYNTVPLDAQYPGSSLQFASISREFGSTVDFSTVNSIPQFASMSISSPPALANGIIGGWATLNESGFASLSGSAIVAATTVSYLPSALPTSNVVLSSGASSFSWVLFGNQTINSLVVDTANPFTMDFEQSVLSLSLGGLLFNRASGNVTAQLSDGTLTTAPGQAELFLYGFGSTSGYPIADISADITDNGVNPVALVVSGALQTIQLSGTNSYSGGTYVAGGELMITQTSAFPANTAVDIADGVLSLDSYQLEGTYDLSSLTLHAGSSISLGGFASIDANTYTVFGGVKIRAYFIGTGTLTKLGEGPATMNISPSLVGDPPYTGTINISQGSLIASPGVISLGMGFLNVGPGTDLVNDAGTLPNAMILSGDLSGSTQNNVTPVFSGPISVAGQASITTFDTLYNQVFTGNFVGGNVLTNLTFAGPVLVQGSSALTKIDAGTLTFTGPITDNGFLDLGAGPTLSGGIAGAGTLNIGAGGALTSDGITVSTFTLGGTSAIRPNIAATATTGTSEVHSLLIAVDTNNQFTGQLDITNNAFILEATDPTDKAAKIAFLQSAVQSGNNGGTWTGEGITSSAVAADAAAGTNNSYHTTLGIFDNGAFPPGTAFTSFGGQPVDANSILITRALVGDANLDGTVNNTDLVALLTHYNQTGQTQATGDYNGDGTVNNTDLVALLTDYGQSLPGAMSLAPADAPDPSAENFATSPVPEPTSLSLFPLAVAALILRRRRHPPTALRHGG